MAYEAEITDWVDHRKTMVIDMNDSKLKAFGQIQEFLQSTADIEFQTPSNEGQKRDFIAKTLKRFVYFRLRKGQRSILFRYLQRLTGYSRAYLSRLIAPYREQKYLKPNPEPVARALCGAIPGYWQRWIHCMTAYLVLQPTDS